MPAMDKSLSGLEKAAILLLLLGEEATTTIYKNLPPGELQLVTQQISALQNVPPEVADCVLREYHRLSMTQEFIAEGGTDVAEKMLSRAFGEQSARMLLDQVLLAREAATRSFDTLQKADPQQLVKFVQGEHPQTIAMILAHLGGKSASSLLVLLPDKVRGQAIRRLAEMQEFSPEMVQKISLVLNRKVLSLGEQSRRSYGGVKTAAELLNRIDPTISKSILESLESDDARLALNIRNNMFTFEDLLGVPEAGIRDLLSTVDKKTLSIALKGAPEDLKNHLFKSMSTRAVEMMREDMEALGPLRAQMVVKAQQEVVQAARTLEAQGKLVLNNEAEEAFIV
ncbi:MAG TPA: flagellar motor switch protein FliG [Candidatus Acidoferrales bacterium]|jgi:flagellar motor switch protein FliG